uniref:Tectonin-2 n=1 Tax=Physarum polycephalum TaxID=5791 RepID=TCT2_PHYPO|nr:RecName: Full=Tectonin-2; AltName: Full=Tectonin II [Physarum polycephalum]AAC06201.1 tectonin II [Physarum polycephalum]
MATPVYIVLPSRPDHVVSTAKDHAVQGYTELHPYDPSQTEGRLWIFDNDGYIRLAANHNLVLDVNGGAAKEGNTVLSYPDKKDHAKNQLWVNKDCILHTKLDESFHLGVNDKGQVIITQKKEQRVILRAPASLEKRPSAWERHEGELNVVAVGAGNHDVWGVNHLEHIYHWDGSKWHQIEGAATNISVGLDGTVWCVNKAHEIYRLDRGTNKWSIVPGELVQVSVGNSHNIWGVNHLDAIYKWNADSNSWTFVDGQLTNVSVGHDGTVYGVNRAGNIYHYNGNSWDAVSGELVQIHVANKDLIVGVNKAGHVYRLKHGKDWEKLEGELSWVAVGHGGELWGANSAHNIYKALL